VIQDERIMENEKINSLLSLIETVRRLRAPGGCPWDIEQTHQSLRPFLIEEAYEVLDVLDQIQSPNDLKSPDIQNTFKEELGDLLLQIVLHAEMTAQEKVFDIFDVAQSLNDKLIRRHPHVFSTEIAKTAETVLVNWEKIKSEERKKQKNTQGVLGGVPKNLPSLQRAERVIEKTAKVGFKWDNLQGPLDKMNEELQELKNEINSEQKNDSRIRAELGDLIFSICNLASFLKINPEDALRETTHRFEKRFKYIEESLAQKGKSIHDSNLAEMDLLWNEAKKKEEK